MIREAHIGIGLSGNEGTQAVQTSDYALCEFRHLWRLILVHGRLSYMRNCEMILYFFYKNIVMTFPSFLYTYQVGFSGFNLYDDWYISNYNLFFTNMPLVLRALMDYDVIPATMADQVCKYIPLLYMRGQLNQSINKTQILWYFSLGLLTGCMVFYIPKFALLAGGITHQDGHTDDLWMFSFASFTSIILVVTNKLLIQSRSINLAQVAGSILLTYLVYFGYMFFSQVTFAKLTGTVSFVHVNLTYYAIVCITVAACAVMDFAIQTISVL